MSFDTHSHDWHQQVEAARASARARRPDFDSSRAGVALTLAVVFSFAAFLIGIAVGVRGLEIAMLGVAAFTFLLAMTPLALDQGRARDRRHIFVGLVSLIFVATYILPIPTRYIPGEPPVGAPAMAYSDLWPRDILIGQLVVLLSLAMMLLAYASPVGRVLAERLPRPTRDWPLATIVVVAIAMMSIGWPIQLSSDFGLIPEQFGSGFLGTLVKSTIYCNAILMLAWMRHRSFLAVLLLAVNVGLGLMHGLIIGSKTDMLVRPLIVALTWILVRGKFPVRWFAVAFLALAAIYPASEFVRSIQREGGVTIQRMLTDPVGALNLVTSFASESDLGDWLGQGFEATMVRIDSQGVIAVLVRDTPRVSPFLHGKTLLLFPIAFVPRILWAEKPETGTGRFITHVYGSGPHIDSHTASTQIGDYYINFGVAGVIVGMLLLGVTIRLTHESLIRGGTAPSLLAATVIIFHLTISFNGNVGQVYSNAVFAVVPIWIAQMLVRLFLPTYRRDGPVETPRPRRRRGFAPGSEPASG
jgi:hypothetical protein